MLPTHLPRPSHPRLTHPPNVFNQTLSPFVFVQKPSFRTSCASLKQSYSTSFSHKNCQKTAKTQFLAAKPANYLFFLDCQKVQKFRPAAQIPIRDDSKNSSPHHHHPKEEYFKQVLKSITGWWWWYIKKEKVVVVLKK